MEDGLSPSRRAGCPGGSRLGMASLPQAASRKMGVVQGACRPQLVSVQFESEANFLSLRVNMRPETWGNVMTQGETTTLQKSHEIKGRLVGSDPT